jgi:penicillin-binding protein 1A
MPTRRRPATAPDGSEYDFSGFYRTKKREETPEPPIKLHPRRKKKRKPTLRKRIKRRFLQLTAAGIITLTGLTINAVGNYGFVEKGMSYIPKITGHAEKGKYWDGIHEHQDFLKSIDDTVEFERNRFGLFPDHRIITDYWIEDNNAIRYTSGDGNKLLLTDKPTKEYISLTDIATLADAVIKREDKSFREHHGINWKGTARAAFFLGRRGGGSSLTMQVAKQLMQEREGKREGRFEKFFKQGMEMTLAAEIEQEYSKEQILEFYLNNIYFGPGVYGVQPASEFYFGKDAKKLTTAESLFLATLINTPGDITQTYRKTLREMFPECDTQKDGEQRKKDERRICQDEKREEAKEKDNRAYERTYRQTRREVQRRWVDNRLTGGSHDLANFLEQEEDDDATRTRYIQEVRRKLFTRIDADIFDPEKRRRTEHSNNFPSALSLLLHALENKYDLPIKEMRTDTERVYSLEVRTTIDPTLTRDVNETINKHLGKRAEHYAVVILDQDGNIRTILGDKAFDDFTEFNYATQGMRPIASTMKPFVYAFGIEHDYFKTTSTFSDERDPQCADLARRCISNHDDRYGRRMRIPAALSNSNNVMAASAFGEMRTGRRFRSFREYMQNLGITVENNSPRTAIGIDEGTPLRLALAYASFIDGHPHEYVLVDQVKIGEKAIEQRQEPIRRVVFSPTTLTYMQDALTYVARRKGITHPTHKVGVKTGTYEDKSGTSRDLWMAGTLTSRDALGMGYSFVVWVDNSNEAFGPKANASKVLTPVVQEVISHIR